MLETLSASEVGTTSARLNAKLDLTDVLCRSISYGFYWGTSSSSLNTYLKGGSRAQNAYSAQLTNVSSGTQYWYKAYLKVDGKTYYGAVMTFSTEGVTGIVLNPSSLTLNEGQTSTLTATVSASDAVDKTLTWSSSNTAVATVNQTGKVTAVSKGTATITAAANDGSGRSASCAVTVKRLVSSITLNKESISIYKGKTETLTATVNPSTASNTSVTWSSSSTSVATVSSTGVVTGVSGGSATITASASDGSGVKATCKVTVIAPKDLSSSASANCYIVSSPGTYSFRTVKGNSSTSVGIVSGAEVLWESFGTSTAPSKGDIIRSVSYSGNYITFATPSVLNNGNAVIAAKNGSGNILWSWHIWVCSGYDPIATAQVYYNNAGTMMDRNLGATSATAGDVGALGLHYQWGRKDPFLGSSSISSNTKAASTITWPPTVASNSTNGTIDYAVKHPTIFITRNSKNYDWYYTDSEDNDDTRWVGYNHMSKSIYDPCPPGWRLHQGGDGGVWDKAGNCKYDIISVSYNSVRKGVNLGGKFGSAQTIWYPAAGYLDSKNGNLISVGDKGRWWGGTCSLREPYADNLLFIKTTQDAGDLHPESFTCGADGLSVRCLKE